jgi:hypothetical protein
MQSTLIVALSFILLANVNGCKEKKENKTDAGTYSSNETSTPPKDTHTTTATPPLDTTKKESPKEAPVKETSTSNNSNYRLVVQFYSKGGGTDYKLREKYDQWLASYKPAVKVEQTPWGREGEVDYCIKLAELDNTKQAEFVTKTKELLSKSELVHIYENHPCSRKR